MAAALIWTNKTVQTVDQMKDKNQMSSIGK